MSLVSKRFHYIIRGLEIEGSQPKNLRIFMIYKEVAGTFRNEIYNDEIAPFVMEGEEGEYLKALSNVLKVNTANHFISCDFLLFNLLCNCFV